MGQQMFARHEAEDQEFFQQQEQMEVVHPIQNSQPVVKDNIIMAA